jgi:hypothetical protein
MASVALLSPQAVTRAGLNPSFVAADAAGDTFLPGTGVMLRVKNASAAAVTVTVNSVRPCDQGFDHDVAVSVPAGGDVTIGLFPSERFAGAGGVVSVTYSATASVSVAVIA